jgi:hypothetical protein
MIDKPSFLSFFFQSKLYLKRIFLQFWLNGLMPCGTEGGNKVRTELCT